jgi:Domain of unknown function (DUF305)
LRSLFFTRGRSVAIIVLFAAIVGSVTSGRAGEMSGQQSAETQFLAENEIAMSKMMAGMSGKPTGDIDRDFVDMMVPHHQGAVDMAKSELKYGHNEQLRRLAQEIIVTQQQEITVMRQAVGENDPAAPLPASGGAMKMQMSPGAMGNDSMNMK